MSEIRLQSDIARRFSELYYPERRGQLFHVANERNHALQAIQAKGIGIFPGVSDFIYFNGLNLWQGDELVNRVPFMLGIEVKESGKYHSKDHVQQQVDWGRTLERNGGKWVLVTSVDAAIEAIEVNYINCLNLDQVQKMLDDCTKKRNTLHSPASGLELNGAPPP